ncbi:MAG: nucleolar RNA-binding Nop10p family protein [Candidatus Pacearchaeota archaeon]
MNLKKCPKCATYTLKDICPKCATKTLEAHYKFRERFLKNSQESIK